MDKALLAFKSPANLKNLSKCAGGMPVETAYKHMIAYLTNRRSALCESDDWKVQLAFMNDITLAYLRAESNHTQSTGWTPADKPARTHGNIAVRVLPTNDTRAVEDGCLESVPSEMRPVGWYPSRPMGSRDDPKSKPEARVVYHTDAIVDRYDPLVTTDAGSHEGTGGHLDRLLAMPMIQALNGGCDTQPLKTPFERRQNAEANAREGLAPVPHPAKLWTDSEYVADPEELVHRRVGRNTNAAPSYIFDSSMTTAERIQAEQKWRASTAGAIPAYRGSIQTRNYSTDVAEELDGFESECMVRGYDMEPLLCRTSNIAAVRNAAPVVVKSPPAGYKFVV